MRSVALLSAALFVGMGLSVAPAGAEPVAEDGEELVQGRGPGGRPGGGRPGARPGGEGGRPEGFDADRLRELREQRERERAEQEGQGDAGGDEAKPALPEFTQPEIESFPEDEARTRETFKRAFERAYSARRAGLERFSADATLAFQNIPGMGELAIDSRLAWVKGESVRMRIVESGEEDEELRGMLRMARQQLRGQLEQFSRMLDFLIGFEEFDATYMDAVFAAEKSEDRAVTIIREWRRKGETDEDGFSSTIHHVRDGLIVASQTADSAISMEYERSGRNHFVSAVTMSGAANLSDEQRRQLEGAGGAPGRGGRVQTEMNYTVATRERVGAYHIGTVMNSKMNMGFMSLDMEFRLSAVRVNDDVTDAIWNDAKERDAAEEAPAPAPAPGGDDAPAPGGESGDF